jgi:GNAT superfamily N-acetyltransferase
MVSTSDIMILNVCNPGNAMKIREATHADSKWILHHRIGMFKDMGEPEDFILETTELTEQYLKDDWTQDYRYFLVEENDTIVGGCGLSTFRIPPLAHQKTGVYAYLSNMYIEPEHRRKGLGKALTKHVVDICKRDGIGLLLLHASKGGYPLYESQGFNTPKGLMHLIVQKHTD